MLVLGAGGRRGRSLRATGGGRGAAAPGGLAVPLCATAVLGRVPAAGALSLQRILVGSPLAQPLESFLPAAAVSQLHCHPAGEERGPGEAPPRSLAARLPLNMAAVVCSRSSHGPPAAARPSPPPGTPHPGPRAPVCLGRRPGTQGRQGHRAAARWPRPDGPARAAPRPVGVERDPESRVRGSRFGFLGTSVGARNHLPDGAAAHGPRGEKPARRPRSLGCLGRLGLGARAPPPQPDPSRPPKRAWHLARAPAPHASPQSWPRSGSDGPRSTPAGERCGLASVHRELHSDPAACLSAYF